MSHEWQHGEFTISDDFARLNFAVIHHYLSTESYWAQGRAREIVECSFANSHSFGIYIGERQIGWARVVTDYATFAWVADVFIVPEFRGLGLSKRLMEVIMSHPDLQNFRRWLLATKDAHELYRKFGFTELEDPQRWMERFNP